MKKEHFQNWDEFNPDDWIPKDSSQFYVSTDDWNQLGYFYFDDEDKQLEIGVKETITIPINTNDGRWYNDTVNAINKIFMEWDLDPYRVSWVYHPSYYKLDGNYYSYLQETINPRPSMRFYTYEDNKVCLIDSKYYIAYETTEVKLRFNQFIYNDNAKPLDLWNEFLKLAKKRIWVPFSATLQLPGEEHE